MQESDQPVFQTERLTARRWSLDLAEQALTIYGDHRVTEHIPQIHAESIDKMREMIKYIIERNSRFEPPFGSFPVFLTETDQMVGTALIKNLPDAEKNFTEDIEIGWHLAYDFWGQGLATEFGRELIRIGFEDAACSVIYAVTDLENYPSQAVCKRLGMDHVGQTEKYYGQRLELFQINASG